MEIESNKLSALTPCIVWTLVAFAVFLIYFATGYSSLGPSIDGCTYAGAARAIVQGEGTFFGWVSPINFAGYKPGDFVEPAQVVPAMSKYFWPLIIALFFSVFGVGDHSVALACGFVFAAAVPFMFLTARDHFSQRAGHVAAALYVFNGMILSYTATGMSENLIMFMLAAFIWYSTRPGVIKPALVSAFIFAAALATKPTAAAWFGPLLLLLLVKKESRWLRAVLAITLALLFSKGGYYLFEKPFSYPLEPPERVRMENPVHLEVREPSISKPNSDLSVVQESGGFWDKVFGGYGAQILLVHSPRYPGHSFSRGLDQADTSLIMQADFRLFIDRALANLRLTLKALFWKLTNPILIVLFWIGLIRFMKLTEFRFILISFLFVVCCVAALQIATFAWARYYHPLAVFYVIVAAGIIGEFSQMFKKPKAAKCFAIALTALCCVPIGFAAGLDWLIPVSDKHALRVQNSDMEYYSRITEIVNRNLGPDDTLVCDIPAFAAWYGNRKTVWLPNDMDTFARLRARANVDYVLFLFQFRRAGYDDNWKKWLLNLPDDPESARGLTLVDSQMTPRGGMYLFKTGVEYDN